MKYRNMSLIARNQRLDVIEPYREDKTDDL